MKKSRRALLIIAIVISVLLIVAAMYVVITYRSITAFYRTETVVVPDVNFGTKRTRIHDKFGDPEKTEQDPNNGAIWDTYSMDLNGITAEVNFGFSPRSDTLYDMYVKFSSLPDGKAKTLLQDYTHQYKRAFPRAEFEYKENKTEITIPRGPEAICFTVTAQGASLTVHCFALH